MPDRDALPRVPPSPLQALFPDVRTARTAVETLLQGGFLSEQLGLVRADESVLSAANDPAVYRATGLDQSRSAMDVARGDDPHALEERERELAMLREHAVIVTVAPEGGQEGTARELLLSMGGRMLRPDGRVEEAA